MNMINFIQDMGVSGVFDIAFMWILVYTLLLWAKKTRAGSVLTGILVVAGFYLLTRQFNLTLTSAVFERFFAVILIALVVIFQEELRHFFEQIAVWTSLNRRVKKRQLRRITREEVGVLVRTVNELAKERIGALIVIRGRDLIIRHLEGGVELGGKLSEALLHSLFDPSSMGHDGAVVVEGTEILQFSCHLPLSKNLKKIGKGGTRHAAGLGLSELSDALCVIVSEERGTISIARNGDLVTVKSTEKLTEILEKFYQEIHPKRQAKPWEGYLKRNWKEKTYAFILSTLLWIVLVFGSKSTYKTFIVPVTYDALPTPWKVTELEPKKVYVTLGGPRNAFLFMDKDRLKVDIDIPKYMGENRIRIYPTDIAFPKDLVLEVLAPQEVKVYLEQEEKEETETAVPEKKRMSSKPRMWKRILPFIGNGKEPSPETSPPRETAPSEAELATEDTIPEPEVVVEEKAEPVETLENVEPEEVIKFLEKSLDPETVIEPIRLENGTESAEKDKP